MLVAQNIELFAHALTGTPITIIFIPNKDPKYRTVRLSIGHLATLVNISNLNNAEPLSTSPLNIVVMIAKISADRSTCSDWSPCPDRLWR